MTPTIVEGDLLEQDVDVIVNSWNRNFIPWWLLIPQGVSGAIRRRAGIQPLREIGREGLLPLGAARLTSAGRLPYRGIIHVAGINAIWRATERSIRESVRNAMQLVEAHGFASVAFPIIGAGSGGMGVERAMEYILTTLDTIESSARVLVVRYVRKK